MAGRVGIFVVLAAALIPSAASAQNIYQAFLSPNGPGAPCYARSEAATSDRFAPERRQRLQRFFVRAGDNSGLLPPRAFRVAFGFTLRDLAETFTGTAACEAVGTVARCAIPQDGGRFTLAPRDDGLRLTIGNKLVIAGPTRFSPDLADGQDDLIFALSPADAAACSAEPASNPPS